MADGRFYHIFSVMRRLHRDDNIGHIAASIEEKQMADTTDKIPVTDILERLRTKYCCTTEDCNCEEAADTIERLQAENEALRHDLERYMTIANEHVNEAERLREALKRIQHFSPAHMWRAPDIKVIISAALEQSK